MYQISVEKHFDAAHFLRGYRGKCEALHGHRFRAVARVSATKLDDIGLAYDFNELKRHLNDILDRFDHTCLNDVPPFDKINPSSENIAAAIHGELRSKLAEAPVAISAIEVWESPQTRIIYRPD
ncbi:MAG: 6-carboxytetrahydropterin synthase QueD [Dehalococcoidales bacterium]|jgi:6-pyruvoyltetrahydropterin/6-carboxytetrahydropterin synthase|nr:6-carboxytetrahydropterin synthase QueD [Dehalococcoidales bacterium]MDP6448828.1 6-carboxytetrahydropterin synthase QueD [Dehalococcoidales bacterium]MDP6577101.1 6-carboxytetrahydropterin synthase QueD [Dehalococcoidales bacterium]MDP6824573.1 6-carboxytetrahydropterin synthase QueD [Dehalococcoidales bacterium]|tara:strand:+ start:136 stop:507 length:372 start_codon:yes stop_codon:yes gene_type:complete